jgi:hypothetical protein
MRHALLTIRLLDRARDGTIAQAEADERLEHQAQATLRAEPAEPGRVITLARRVRGLVARTSRKAGSTWSAVPGRCDR